MNRESVTGQDTALIGYGRMGRPMGRRLLAAGNRLFVYDVDTSAGDAATADGAVRMASTAEASAAAGTLITMLPDPGATVAASDGEHGILTGIGSGALRLERGSSDPATTRDLAHAAEARSAALLDAPVSGGVVAAEAGTQAIMVGGRRNCWSDHDLCCGRSDGTSSTSERDREVATSQRRSTTCCSP